MHLRLDVSRRVAVAVAALLLLPLTAWATPTDDVKGTIDRVIKIVTDPGLKPQAKTKERRAEIRKTVGERFNFGDRDFTAQLLALKQAGAEVMIPYSAGHEELARIIVQYRQLGTPYQYLGPPAIGTKTLLDLAKEAAEGLIGFVDAVPGMNETNRKFVEAYRKEFNSEPDMQASWEYDALNILINAIRTAGEDRAKIREAILATKGYEGIYGMYNFTPDGEGLHGGPFAIIKNGKPQLMKMVYVNE